MSNLLRDTLYNAISEGDYTPRSIKAFLDALDYDRLLNPVRYRIIQTEYSKPEPDKQRCLDLLSPVESIGTTADPIPNWRDCLEARP